MTRHHALLLLSLLAFAAPDLAEAQPGQSARGGGHDFKCTAYARGTGRTTVIIKNNTSRRYRPGTRLDLVTRGESPQKGAVTLEKWISAKQSGNFPSAYFGEVPIVEKTVACIVTKVTEPGPKRKRLDVGKAQLTAKLTCVVSGGGEFGDDLTITNAGKLLVGARKRIAWSVPGTQLKGTSTLTNPLAPGGTHVVRGAMAGGAPIGTPCEAKVLQRRVKKARPRLRRPAKRRGG